MSVDLASELWAELKRYVSVVDRSEAADSLVNLLVDHNYDADDIKAAFKGDSEVKKAIQVYLDDHADESEEDEDDSDYEDEDEDY